MTKTIQKAYLDFLLICSVITLLLLTSLNFTNHLGENKNVLGAETENQDKKSDEIIFWKKMTSDHPTYYDGWSELHRLTGEESCLKRALEIAPNRPAP